LQIYQQRFATSEPFRRCHAAGLDISGELPHAQNPHGKHGINNSDFAGICA